MIPPYDDHDHTLPDPIRIVDGRSAAIRTHGGDGLIATSGWHGLRGLRTLLGHGPVTESRVPGIVAWMAWLDRNGDWGGPWSVTEACDAVSALVSCTDSADWQWKAY